MLERGDLLQPIIVLLNTRDEHFKPVHEL